MERCGGALVVHMDASAAACTEELEGRCCPGPHACHDGGQVCCQDVLGPGGCETCAGESIEGWPPLLWRHVAHIGRLAGRQRLCAAHRRRGALAPQARERQGLVTAFGPGGCRSTG